MVNNAINSFKIRFEKSICIICTTIPQKRYILNNTAYAPDDNNKLSLPIYFFRISKNCFNLVPLTVIPILSYCYIITKTTKLATFSIVFALRIGPLEQVSLYIISPNLYIIWQKSVST